jgi:hypothetical protein
MPEFLDERHLYSTNSARNARVFGWETSIQYKLCSQCQSFWMRDIYTVQTLLAMPEFSDEIRLSVQYKLCSQCQSSRMRDVYILQTLLAMSDFSDERRLYSINSARNARVLGWETSIQYKLCSQSQSFRMLSKERPPPIWNCIHFR